MQTITQARDGYLWLGTEDGLPRFDGVKFTVFNRQNTPALRNNYITALFESADGALWIGTGDGLSRFQNGKLETFGEDEGLPIDNIRAVFLDRRKMRWSSFSARKTFSLRVVLVFN